MEASEPVLTAREKHRLRCSNRNVLLSREKFRADFFNMKKRWKFANTWKNEGWAEYFALQKEYRSLEWKIVQLKK